MMLGSIQSQAELGFRHDAERDRTVLAVRKTGGLCHVSKPYWDGEVLGTQVINPTAGLFAGDELGMNVRIGKNARVALTSPSATRYYAMDGAKATVKQEFHVEEGGFLEYRPDWVIPQQNSDVEQSTIIDVADGAELVFFDRLSPGRVAHGESYQYRRYVTSLELRHAGELCARERMVLEPDMGGWPLTVPGWDVCFFGALWLVGDGLKDHFSMVEALESELTGDGVHCGVTALSDRVAVVRLLVARGLLMKQSLLRARQMLEPVFPRLKGGQRTL